MIFTTCTRLRPKCQLNHEPTCVIAGFGYKNKYKKLLEPGRIVKTTFDQVFLKSDLKVSLQKTFFIKFDQKSSFVKTTFDQIFLKSDLKVSLQKTTFDQICQSCLL
jgi:hypothetical protein